MSGDDGAALPLGSERFTTCLVVDVFEVLERHGYVAGDDAHVGAAFGLLWRLTETYEGRDPVQRRREAV